MMSVLPDELWRRIMEIGTETKTLDYKSLCCLSITCRRLHRLAAEDSLWSPLLLSDFPSSDSNLDNYDTKVSVRDDICSSSSTADGRFKSLYRIRYEKDRDQKLEAHRRAVLRIESEIAEHSRKIRAMELQSFEENLKMSNAAAKLQHLRRIRQASVALNVWQPEVVRAKQSEMVQQSNVPVDCRINALEMEVNLCKQQIAGFNKAIQKEKRRLHKAEEELDSVKYHPLQDLGSSSRQPNESKIRSKKLKHTSLVKM